MKTKHILRILSILLTISLLFPQNILLAQAAHSQGASGQNARGQKAAIAASPAEAAAFTCAPVSEIPQLECEALVVLYTLTNGANWTNNTNWLQTTTPSAWYGVTVTAGHVTELSLFNNTLIGILPPELGNLPELVRLDLGSNSFYFTIPPTLGSLTNLQYLDLSYKETTDYTSGLEGNIPPELGNLTKLTTLNLARNALAKMPPELGNLVNLQTLDLSGQLYWEYMWMYFASSSTLKDPLPDWLANLTNLTHLYLQNNALTGSLSPALGNLANLQVVNLTSNQFSGSLPSELSSLTNLKELDLAYNAFIGPIPAGLTSLNNLTVLNLGYNGLFATDPALVTFLNTLNPDWANTQTISPTDLRLEGITLSWTPILFSAGHGYYEISYAAAPGGPYTVLASTPHKFTHIYQISGLAPGNYSFRIRTYTPGDPILSTVPPQVNSIWSEYSTPISVTVPVLSITKTSPAFAFAGDPITYTLQINNLSAANLTGLTITDTLPVGAVYLRGGSRNGQIIEWTAPNLAPLSSLSFQFVVSATQTITNTSYGVQAAEGFTDHGSPIVTQEVNAFCAQVSEIPSAECRVLGTLFIQTHGSQWLLNRNWLQNLTPSNWFGVGVISGHVTSLNLYTNGLTGSLPPELGSLSNLTILNLANNALTGSIPSQIGNLTSLTELNLASNALNGSIPVEIGNLNNLTQLNLYHNLLSGALPTEIGSLSALTVLILSTNKLSGNIPASLLNLTNLTFLNLEYNALSASDPALINFLNAHDTDWHSSQTLPPTNLKADGSMLFWTPISFKNFGNYEISYAPASGGAYQVLGYTLDKYASTYQVLGVPIGVYNFRLRTHSTAVSLNQDGLWSDYTAPISVTINALEIYKTAPAYAIIGSPITYTLHVTNHSPDLMTNLTITDTIPGGAYYLRGGLKNGLTVEWQAASLAPSATLDVQFVVTATQTITNSKYGASAAGGFTAAGKPVVTKDAFQICEHVTNIPLIECQALVTLYANTQGYQWNYDTNWLQTFSIWDWHGVSVSEGHVAGLRLRGNNLKGALPPELATLPNLAVIDLADNALTGSIPSAYGSLVNLLDLQVGSNFLSGSIPPELGNLTNLQTLELGENAFSGAIPTELANLTNLSSLVLFNNALTASDPALRAFLDARNYSWETTQTVAPANLSLSYATLHEAVLTWDPISYKPEGGYYQVYSATQPAGPFTLLTSTPSLTDYTLTIANLNPDSTYYFYLRAYTPAYYSQKNELWSSPTQTLSVHTAKQILFMPMLGR